MKTTIVVQTIIHALVEKVWEFYTTPKHILQWNNASNDWHTPRAENNLKVGGKFIYRMEAKDGSSGFDFGGKYSEIKINELIVYSMDDGRKVSIIFSKNDSETKVAITFEAEEVNSLELQRLGWQAILNNFKKYVENKK